MTQAGAPDQGPNRHARRRTGPGWSAPWAPGSGAERGERAPAATRLGRPGGRLERLRVQRRRVIRNRVLAGTGAAAVLGLLMMLLPSGETPVETPAAFGREENGGEAGAIAAAQRFLHGYVDPDGRVVRRDQGGDTVSEGQAYALLLAVAVGDEARFADIWAWTRARLQRPDDLLAWLWRDGEVVDESPASDADIDAAHALLLAAERFDRPDYRDQGLSMARAIRERETRLSAGRPLLMAGPWAINGTPAVNPSYFDPRAFARFGAATGDRPWWESLTVSSYDVVDALRAGGDVLPPDWAQITTQGIRATGPPDAWEQAPRYSFDAARLPVRMATACDPRGRELAASLWPTFRDAGAGNLRLAYDLSGSPINEGRHPLTLVGAAGIAAAAGRPLSAERFLDEAEALDAELPSYYGAAWVALGRVLLTSTLLGGCPA